MRKKLLGLIFLLLSTIAFGQKGEKVPRYFGNPNIADSASTLMIPVQYNVDLLSANKIALWHNYYANIIFYDFINDTSKKLFKEDTFIKGFSTSNNYYPRYERDIKKNNTSKNWVFYFVIETDYNKNGRIDDEDPSVLFVSDKKGNELKALTPPNENAISIEIFDKQGFALIKMQRDLNKDKNFNNKDKDYYFVRLDLDSLTFGNRIEVKETTQP
jgi:hypothetical protein